MVRTARSPIQFDLKVSIIFCSLLSPNIVLLGETSGGTEWGVHIRVKDK
jgi:hypothetical protein